MFTQIAGKKASSSNQPGRTKRRAAAVSPMQAKSIAPWAQHQLPIQFSLKVNTPGDRFEQEADRVAEQVMRLPEPAVQRKSCGCGKAAGADGMCEACKKKKLGIQRMPSSKPSQTTAPPVVDQVLQQPGRPLDFATRNFMESRFERNFGGIRVHTDEVAAKSADSVHAQAYTVNDHVVFNTNEFNPSSSKGRYLLAHELTHSIQQQGMASLASGITLQRVCQDESFYSSSSDYCRDDTFSPLTHSGETCYRQIPTRSGYFSCPPGEHVCFDSSGNCKESPDRSSLAESRESDGSCNWNGYCVAQHTAVDFVPEVADQMVEPFREIGREMSKALDWRNWMYLSGY